MANRLDYPTQKGLAIWQVPFVLDSLFGLAHATGHL